jgi:RNA 2',3'-cyclic 3'-phosphodiesterase
MRRIFIAVKIEPRNTLTGMISELKAALKDDKIKWTEPGNFHITLAFLGDTEEDKINAVAKMLKRVCQTSGKFDLFLKGAGIFKSINDPRVLWTGIAPSENLNILFESVRTGLNDAGITIEERKFNPHLTLGRIKSIKDNGMLKVLISGYQNVEIQKEEIREVILYESLLFHTGPVYKPLGKFALVNKGRREGENGRRGA